MPLRKYWYKVYGMSITYLPTNWEGQVEASDEFTAIETVDRMTWKWVCDHITSILIYEIDEYSQIASKPCTTRTYPKSAAEVEKLTKMSKKIKEHNRNLPTVIAPAGYTSTARTWETADWLESEGSHKRKYATITYKETVL